MDNVSRLFSSNLTASVPGSNWFEEVFGFPEPPNYAAARSGFRIENEDGGELLLFTVPPAGLAQARRRFHVGKFETPSLFEIRSLLHDVKSCERTDLGGGGGIAFDHIVADVASLHRSPSNTGAVFQAASQFNCLEMVHHRIRPDDGITRYYRDGTQGPACAMSCPAGTVYRNYFVGGNGQGGPAGKQIDTLEDVGRVLGNTPVGEGDAGVCSTKPRYWKMKNGYCLPAGRMSIAALNSRIKAGGRNIVERSMEKLRVGVHWNTEVIRTNARGWNDTALETPHQVAQVYCSAVPISYDYTASARDWEPFARLILDGAYEATLAVAAVIARRQRRRVRVFLTKIGGGVFQNDKSWISSSIARALDLYREHSLDVFLVHYGHVEPYYATSNKPIGTMNDMSLLHQPNIEQYVQTSKRGRKH